jgi:hypothetical protein
MTVVFVHGVPSTGVIWNGVRAHLGGDPDGPGFLRSVIHAACANEADASALEE